MSLMAGLLGTQSINCLSASHNSLSQWAILVILVFPQIHSILKLIVCLHAHTLLSLLILALFTFRIRFNIFCGIKQALTKHPNLSNLNIAG